MKESFVQTLENQMFTEAFRRAGGGRIDLWWLDRGGENATFLYGWILPSAIRSPTLAITSNLTALRDTLAIAQWSFIGEIEQLLRMVRGWIAGESLTVVPSAVVRGRTAGESMTAVPPAVGHWHLPIDQMTPMPLSYQLPPARAHMSTPSERAAPSPLSEAPAYCVGLARVSKAALFEGVESDAQTIIAALTALVGFDFAYDHALRLGNLEAFAFPSCHTENPGVDFSFRGNSLRVVIDRALIPAGSDAIVRCSESASGRVLSDRLRLVPWADLTEPITFAMSDDGPWSTLLDVWVSCEGQDATSWFSHVFVPMRSLSITTLVSSATPAGPGWLGAWGARKEISRVGAGLSRFRERERSAVPRDYPAWFTADLYAHDLARLLAPAVGVDRFTIGGIAELATGGVLGELFGRLAPGEASDVLLVDPMFDDYGLTLLAKLGLGQVACHVLTIASPARRDAIERIAAFARASVLPFEVGAIELDDGAVSPIGCYFLVLDSNGEALRGFQLSASISFATRNLPLLVNQIDSAALGAVAEWIRALQRCDPALVGPGSRFSTLWPQTARVIDTTSRRVDDQQIAEAMATLADDLDDDTWALRWEAAADLLANFANHENLLAEAALPIVSRIEALLGDVDRLAMLRGRSERISSSSYALLDSMSLSTIMQYHRAWDVATHWSAHNAWWAVWLAAEALLLVSPPAAVRVLDKYIERLSVRGDQWTATRITCVSTLLHHIVRHLHGAPENITGLEQALLTSKTALIQGLGVASIGRRVIDLLEPGTNSDLAGLALLPLENRICAFAECTYRLRVRANRAGGETDRDRHIRSILFALLSELWPQARPNLREIVFHLEGPTIGKWASSTTFDLLLPLVEKHHLALHEVVDLWTGELTRRWLGLLTGTHYFYVNADGPLTLLVAKLMSQPGASDMLLDSAHVLAVQARGVLERPFSRSSNYERWSNARAGLAWLRAFGQLLNRSHDARVQQLLVPVFSESTLDEAYPNDLYQFARDVDRRTAST